MEGGSIETLKKMIRKVGGYTLVPELSFQPQDAPNVVRFRDPQPVREISLVVHRFFTRENLLSRLQSAIQSELPGSLRRAGAIRSIPWR